MVNVGIYTIHGSYGKGKSLVKFDIILVVSLVPFSSDLCPTGQPPSPLHRALFRAGILSHQNFEKNNDTLGIWADPHDS